MSYRILGRSVTAILVAAIVVQGHTLYMLDGICDRLDQMTEQVTDVNADLVGEAMSVEEAEKIIDEVLEVTMVPLPPKDDGLGPLMGHLQEVADEGVDKGFRSKAWWREVRQIKAEGEQLRRNWLKRHEAKGVDTAEEMRAAYWLSPLPELPDMD